MADQPQAAAHPAPHPLWFSPPDRGQSHRRALTRQRVIAEALAVISADGVAALSMRALAEAFLAPLHAAGMAERQAALAFRLIYDYTLGFALSDRTSASEQRLQDTTTRHQLHAFLRSLPADRFPILAALGEHVWLDDRDQRFTASLHTLISGLQATQPDPRHLRH